MPPRSPLPPRLGLGPAWLRTEDTNRGRETTWRTMREWLIHRISAHVDVDAFLADERFVLQSGEPLRADEPYRDNTFVWFYRDLPEEAVVPGQVNVVYRDERILVVDKPPFLSSIPRGKHVRESVVVRLRHELGLPELTPLHRLDRVTSGLLLLATERRWRGSYQSMFMRGEVSKTYQAVAPVRSDLELPLTVRNHLVKERGVLQAAVVPGAEPNAESQIALEEVLPDSHETHPGSGVYRLTPRTGKTHQLRMHMWGLGIPIAGDPLYPDVLETAIDDFRTPLQLLASELRFKDPVDGSARSFASERRLPLTG